MNKMSVVDFHKELDHVHHLIHKEVPPTPAHAPAHAPAHVHALIEALHAGSLAAVVAHIPEAEKKLHVLDEKLKADFQHFHDQVKKTVAAGEHSHPAAEHVERLNAYKKYLAARVPPAK